MFIRAWLLVATFPLAVIACKSGQDSPSPENRAPVQASPGDAHNPASAAPNSGSDAQNGGSDSRPKASFTDPKLEAPVGDPKAPENVVREWIASFNRGDIEGIKRVTADDMITVGIALCKGAPCTTQKQHIDGFVKVSLLFKCEMLRVRPGPRGTWTALVQSRLDRVSAGSEIVRAYWNLTIKDGLITRMANYYDLDDPGTVLLRAGIGDFAFGLRDPDPFDKLRVLGMVTWVGREPGKETSAVTLYSKDPSLDVTRLSSSLHKGTCANPGPAVHQLQDLFEGRSDTLLNVNLNTLTSGELVAAVWSPEKELVACGALPGVKVNLKEMY